MVSNDKVSARRQEPLEVVGWFTHQQLRYRHGCFAGWIMRRRDFGPPSKKIMVRNYL